MMAAIIAEREWFSLRSRDAKDAIKVARLENTIQEVEILVIAMKFYKDKKFPY